MKNQSTTTHTIKASSLLPKSFIIGFAMICAVAGPISMVQTVSADQYDDKIKALQSQVNGYQNQAAQLSQQSASLQQAIDSLTAQKNTIQAQLSLSQAQLDKIQADIAANEKKLADQQSVLSSIISVMISGNQTTPIEMLASSSTVGDYIAQQDQLTATSGQLKGSIDTINQVKKELESQRTEQQQVVSDQTAQRNELATKESEQAQLLAETQGQEASYQNLIGQTNAQISAQRAAQAAANAALSRSGKVSNLSSGGASCGGYPALWCNSTQDSIVDSWGMLNRECVSYTAWKVASTGRYMPYWGGRGNADEWPGDAVRAGIPSGSMPKVGSVAIGTNSSYFGSVGHAMYVERVNDNGTIHVSQFNYLINGLGWGRYSEMDISTSLISTFIYF